MKKVGFDVSLADLLNSHAIDINQNMNCHAVGTIKSFDSATQTCSFQIGYKKTILRNGIQSLVDYPLLLDIPVIVISGGTSGLTMPIAIGDTAILMFNDRDIDNWFSGATTGSLASNRTHALSDGIALVGLRPLNKSIQDYDSQNPCLYNGTTRIKVKAAKVLLENSTDKLGLVLKELVDTIKLISTTNCVVGAPVLISPASKAQLDLVAVKIQGLLE